MARKAQTLPIDKVKEIFLEALSRCGHVTEACRLSGVNKATVYRHRKSDPKFAQAWAEAADLGVESLIDEARRRAFEGCDEPVYYRGEVVGSVKKYSDVLLMFLIKGHRPEYRDRAEIRNEINVGTEVPQGASLLETIRDRISDN